MNFDFSENYILENEWNDDVKSKLKNSIEK